MLLEEVSEREDKSSEPGKLPNVNVNQLKITTKKLTETKLTNQTGFLFHFEFIIDETSFSSRDGLRAHMYKCMWTY